MSKKILYSLGVGAMLIGMASCSNDNVDGPNIITPDKAVGYAKVSINLPKADGTRADVNFNGYENGSAEEQAITTIHLALYDADGHFVGTGEKISNNDAKPGTVAGNVEKIYSDVFQLYLDEGANTPTQVVAFINTDIKSGDLQSLEDGYAIPVSKEIVGDENNFPMTNSGYYAADDNSASVSEWKMAVPFTYSDATIFDTAEEANKEENKETLAATIYVERLAAKVTVATAQTVDQSNLNYKVVDVLGKDVTLTFDATNWTVTGVATKENVVKSKFGVNNLFSEYNKAADTRSFWAEGVTYNDPFESYYDKTNKKVAENTPLSYLTFEMIKADDADTGDNKFDLSKLTAIGQHEYAPEHTSVLDTEEASILANTYAIVAGKYTISGENQAWFQNGEGENMRNNFYLLLTGMDGSKKVYTAYTKSQLIGLLLSYNNVSQVYDQSGNLKPTNPASAGYDPNFKFSDYFDIKYDTTQGKYVLGEKADATGSVYEQTGATSPISYNSAWTKTTNSRHYYFPNGGAYFNVPIKHAVKGEGADAKTFYGLVRNHSYKLTINKVENLGAPFDENGHDESDPIVPDIDELKEHFINAQIEILSWHVVENGVIL